jgi:hypothetical protein
LLASRGTVVAVFQVLAQLLFVVAEVGLALANRTSVIVDVAILPVAILVVVAGVVSAIWPTIR